MFISLSFEWTIGNGRFINDPIRSGQNIWRDRQADLLGGFEIDDEVELCRLFNWQVGRLGSLEDLVHVSRNTPVAVREIRPVVHESTGLYTA